jgi:hypothetical protein
MLKLPLAALAVGLSASYASADSLKPKENALGPAQSFKCEPIWPVNSPVVASDAPSSRVVSIEFNEETKTPFTVKVVDVAESGEKYKQADQYTRLHFVAIPGHHDYNWYGTGAKGQSLLIHGQLVEKDSSRFGANRWFYYEELFEHGVKISDSQNICNKTK